MSYLQNPYDNAIVLNAPSHLTHSKPEYRTLQDGSEIKLVTDITHTPSDVTKTKADLLSQGHRLIAIGQGYCQHHQKKDVYGWCIVTEMHGQEWYAWVFDTPVDMGKAKAVEVDIVADDDTTAPKVDTPTGSRRPKYDGPVLNQLPQSQHSLPESSD
jgi:hypothetical protein